MVYPAAITLNGKTVENLFPEWHSIMSQSTVTDVSERIVTTLKSKQDELRRCFDIIMSAPPSASSSPRRASYSKLDRSTEFETVSDSEMDTDDEIRQV